VPFCSQCGTENPDVAKFCLACGSPLAAAPPAQEFRKIVTIVFSDLKGSTAMGEKLDSESLREVMTRYFDAMSAELEKHGGVVEKFIGDAIMAVFGLPKLHEDDALRAVRAAADMQQTQVVLNDELERHWGVRLTVRTGVNTGEVVAGDPTSGQRLVTGDAVNVAARLEQAAGEQEVLLGDLTYRLVRDFVEVEEVEPLELKGKSERVPAYRLVGVRADAERPRRLDAPMVGRERELEHLSGAVREAVESRSCRLVTLIGEAGVGKSRLIDEFVRSVGNEVSFLRGRCLAYGDGITFWPLAEAVRQASGILERDSTESALKKLSALSGEAEAEARVASAIGLSPTQYPVAELFWGARKLFEALARPGPLVVLFEDIHWAEKTFLELIEHLLETVADACLLIVCTTRHELIERLPEWSTSPGATRIELARLTEDETIAVAEHLLGRAGLDERVQSRVIAAAEGNPLFVEQLLSMLIDEGLIRFEDGCWRASADIDRAVVPPTIQALLAARLDYLEQSERAVIEPASVIGHVFVKDAVSYLVPEHARDDVGTRLATLADKQLVQPDLSHSLEEEAFRFHHILIRDTAYEGILKRARATFHEQFVEWADSVNREGATEYEEILGYHLEQAYRYRSDLGPIDDHGRALAADAATRLGSAGRRAFARGDMPAAANLLGRANELYSKDDLRRLELIPNLGEALMEIGEFESASTLLGLAVDEALSLGETRLWADAVVTWLLMRRFVSDDLELWGDDVVRELADVIPVLEEISAHDELAKAFRLLGLVYGSSLRWSKQLDAHRKALKHARLASDARLEARLKAEYTACLRDGPTPVAEAIRECEAALERGLEDRQATAFIYCSLARLRAMQGDFAPARELISSAERMREELGAKVFVPLTSLQSCRVETLAGDLPAGERDLRRDVAKLSAMGDRFALPLVYALLANVVCLQGRFEEAGQLHGAANALADADDVEAQALLRSCRARLLAHDGELAEAEHVAREALGVLEGIESPDLRGDCLVTLADVLVVADRREEALTTLEDAVQQYALKGNAVSGDRTLARIDALTAVAEQTA
jgi:class 3 adenylate cyclase/tetratricopeptide (TPR) repeat protein